MGVANRILFVSTAVFLLGTSAACDDSSAGVAATPTQAEGTGTPTAVPTPTAEPTPEPTPTVTPLAPAIDVDVWQEMTTLAVAAEGQGFDLDGDGAADNGFYVAMDVMAASLSEVVLESIANQGPGGSCEMEATGCPLNIQQVQTAQAAAQNIIDTLVSVQSVNVALAAIFESGIRPYAIHVYTSEESHSLEYWSGESIPGSLYSVGERLSYQLGRIQTNTLDSEFGGAGTFLLSIEIQSPSPAPNAPALTLNLEMETPQTQFSWNETSLSNAITGGAVDVIAFVDYAEQILQYMIDQGLIGDDFDLEGALLALEKGLMEGADVMCPSSGDPCMSAMFDYDTSQVVLVL